MWMSKNLTLLGTRKPQSLNKIAKNLLIVHMPERDQSFCFNYNCMYITYELQISKTLSIGKVIFSWINSLLAEVSSHILIKCKHSTLYARPISGTTFTFTLKVKHFENQIKNSNSRSLCAYNKSRCNWWNCWSNLHDPPKRTKWTTFSFSVLIKIIICPPS